MFPLNGNISLLKKSNIIIIREVALRNRFHLYSIIVPLKKIKNMANNRTCVIYHAIDEEKKSEKKLPYESLAMQVSKT